MRQKSFWTSILHKEERDTMTRSFVYTDRSILMALPVRQKEPKEHPTQYKGDIEMSEMHGYFRKGHYERFSMALDGRKLTEWSSRF